MPQTETSDASLMQYSRLKYPNELLNSKTQRPLIALCADIAGWGFASFNISTGDFFATQNINDPELYQLSALVSKSEPYKIIADSKTLELKKSGLNFLAAPITEFNEISAPLPWASGQVWQNHRQAMSAALMIIAYMPNIAASFSPAYFEPAARLQLDNCAISALELVTSLSGDNKNTLLGVLNLCQSEMGTRLLRRYILEPLTDFNTINARQRLTAFLFEHSELREALKIILSAIPDIEHLFGRIASLTALPQDIAAVRDALLKMHDLHNLLEHSGFLALSPWINAAFENSRIVLEGLLETLKGALADAPQSDIIRKGWSEELDKLRALCKNSKKMLSDIELKERQKNQIPNLKLGYNLALGYYIEVSKLNLAKVPSYFIKRQTLEHAERYTTEALKTLYNTIINAENKAKELQNYLFGLICKSLNAALKELKLFAGAIAELDVFYALSQAAVLYDFTRPEIIANGALELKDSRHPILEQMLPSGTFVPNDLKLGEEKNIIILTGPNMSGKSVYLKQIALAVIMAQMGSFVAAREAKISITDRIITRISKAASGETFMAEMREASAILKLATPKSLILLDEVGRGASTFDGISIAWAITEYLYASGHGPHVLFATHYFELTELAEKFRGIANSNISVKEWTNSQGKTEIVFLHKVISGAADKLYGIHVAKLAGLPKCVLERAGQIMSMLQRKVKIEAKNSDYEKSPLLPMFASHPVLDALRLLDPNALTPLKALSLIADWKHKL